MAAPCDASERLAVILTKTMNTTALLYDEERLQATDPIDLKLVLSWLADELRWLLSSTSSIAGLSPPLDASERIERLCSSLRASNIADPMTDEELEHARSCLAIVQPIGP